MTAPVGQGFSIVAELNESGVSNLLLEKTWGVDGQTDSLNVVITNTAGGTWGAHATMVDRVSSRNQVSGWVATAANNTQTAPLVTNPVSENTLTMWFFGTTNDNTLADNTRGDLAYADNIGANGAVALVTEQDVDSSVEACSVTETLLGPNTGRLLTLVLNGPTSASPYDITLVTAVAHARSRINSTGWSRRSNIHSEKIGGLLYEHSVWVCGSPVRSLTVGYRTSADDGETWSAWTTHNSGSIADPAGVSNWASDAHFTPTINVTKNGNVQVFFLAHGDESPMLFWLGTGGPTDVSLDAADVAEWVPPAPWLKAPGSYPRLDTLLSDGTSVLLVRDGTAGNDSTLRVFEQSAADDEVWLDVTPAGLVDFVTGGDEESQYADQCIAGDDSLHISFLLAQQNETDAYHDKYYLELTRLSPGTWELTDASGTVLTMPADQTKGVARVTGLNAGQNPNNGIGLNSDGTPMLPYFLGDGADTRLWLTMRVAGAWVDRDLGIIATNWNLIGAPPKSEYGVVRTPTAWYRNGAIYVAWSSDQSLGPGNRPYVAAKHSTDNGLTWSDTYRLINEGVGNWCPRYDTTALYKHGLLHFAIQLTDEASNFGNPLMTPAFVVRLP